MPGTGFVYREGSPGRRGSMPPAGGADFPYDAGNRREPNRGLVVVERPAGGPVPVGTEAPPLWKGMNYFSYDAMLRRTAVEDSAGVRYFTWDTNGMNLLAERDATGTVVASYTHGRAAVDGIGSCVGQELVQSGQTYYEFDICDHRGSVVRRVNAAGQVTGYFEYDAWGNYLRDEETGASSRFRYQSNWIELKDSDGELYLSPTRVYHARVGRFLGRDPLRGLVGHQTYARCSPVWRVDPRGTRVFILRIPQPGVRTGRARFFALLRYTYAPDSCCPEDEDGSKLRAIAAQHRQIVEQDFNAHSPRYSYTDAAGTAWMLELRVITTVEPATSSRVRTGLADVLGLLHSAIGAFSTVMVTCKSWTELELAKERGGRGLDRGHIGASKETLRTTEGRFRNLLMHELVAHHMNAIDEYPGAPLVTDKGAFKRTHGRDPEEDSIMNFIIDRPMSFYPRHFAAALEDISNIDRTKLAGGADTTSEVTNDPMDPWFKERFGNQALLALNRTLRIINAALDTREWVRPGEREDDPYYQIKAWEEQEIQGKRRR